MRPVPPKPDECAEFVLLVLVVMVMVMMIVGLVDGAAAAGAFSSRGPRGIGLGGVVVVLCVCDEISSSVVKVFFPCINMLANNHHTLRTIFCYV